MSQLVYSGGDSWTAEAGAAIFSTAIDKHLPSTGTVRGGGVVTLDYDMHPGRSATVFRPGRGMVPVPVPVPMLPRGVRGSQVVMPTGTQIRFTCYEGITSSVGEIINEAREANEKLEAEGQLKVDLQGMTQAITKTSAQMAAVAVATAVATATRQSGRTFKIQGFSRR